MSEIKHGKRVGGCLQESSLSTVQQQLEKAAASWPSYSFRTVCSDQYLKLELANIREGLRAGSTFKGARPVSRY